MQNFVRWCFVLVAIAIPDTLAGYSLRRRTALHDEPSRSVFHGLHLRHRKNRLIEPTLPLATSWGRREFAPHSFSASPLLRAAGMCPNRQRNWRSLYGKGRCKKKCRTVADCGRNHHRKICVCDGECGMSCVKRYLNCPPLISIENGYLTYTANFPFDSSVTYSCKDGYVLMGDWERRCQGNGRWSGTEPTCVPAAKCGSPREIPYAQHTSYGNQHSFDQGTMISYHCINGYHSSPPSLTKAKCLAVNGTAIWYGPEMMCLPISCGHPGDIPNGNRTGDSFHYPNAVRYKCHEGYEPVGPLMRRCLPNGRWSGDEPICQPVQCAKPDNPLNGEVHGSSLDYLSTITYICNEGYRLTGQVKRTCQAGRQWQGDDPRCEQVRCPTPEKPRNGYIHPPLATSAPFQSSIQYRCKDGIQPQGAEYAICQRDGTWSNQPPLCLKGCTVPAVEHGQPLFAVVNTTMPHGALLDIKCRNGFQSDKYVFTECNNGEWLPSPPKCIPMKCLQWPKNFPNAIALFITSDHGSVAKYLCNPGYRMAKGNGIFRCINGNWTGADIFCEEVTCDNPRSVSYLKRFNGTIRLEGSMGAYEYHDHFQPVGENRQIQFECPKGSALIGGPNKATCLNGSWMPRFEPTCVVQDYPPMEDRIDWSKLRNKRSAGRDEAITEDDADPRPYWQISTRRRRATNDRSQYVLLSVRSPKRKRKRNHRNKAKEKRGHGQSATNSSPQESFCPPIRENERQSYAVIRYNALPDERFLSGSEVMIRCHTGYQHANQHQNVITCVNGSWTPALPACVPRSCKMPVRPNGFFTWRGEIISGGHSLGHREGAKLFCLRGYELRGEDALECNLGQWLKPLGECVPQSCVIPRLRHGKYKNETVANTTVEHASKIDFYCDYGFYPNPGQGEVHCSYGTLRPHNPDCNEDITARKDMYLSLGCIRPYDIDNAWVYIKEQQTNKLLLIDPQLSIFPNRTIVHYKCSKVFSEDFKHGNHLHQRRRRATRMSSLYTIDEAHSMQCVDGEWTALLLDCAPSGRLPPGVESNSTRLMNLQLFGANKLPCMRPNLTNNPAIVYETRDWLFPHGFRLRVHCTRNVNISWTIRCRRGIWKGWEEHICETVIKPSVPSTPVHTCEFNSIHFKSMAVFYEQRKEPILFKEHLPEGALLTVRCKHVGLYQFTGTKKLLCRAGEWQGGSPRCRSVGIPWKEGQAPPITYRATEGDLSLTNEGDIIVRTSSNLQLDCLVPKSRAQPYWDYSNSYRKYPQQWGTFILESWETGSLEETNNSLHLDAFRLTVFMARPEDSGIYHCITPSGLRHSVRVRVVDVDCPNYERYLKPNSTVSASQAVVPEIQATKANAFGSVLRVTCPVGYKVVGASRIYCLENGEWSHSAPACQTVRCPRLSPTHPAMKIAMTSNEYNSVATFSCAVGLQIQGPRYVRCNESGDWSDPIPNCTVATCVPPDLPIGAKLLSPQPTYTYGYVVRFACEAGYMQTGQDFAVCNEHGLWSNPPPECHRYCIFPGMPEYGDTTSTTRRTYFVGSKVVYYCSGGYKLIGRPDLECLQNGQWSSDIPKCQAINGNDGP